MSDKPSTDGMIRQLRGGTVRFQYQHIYEAGSASLREERWITVGDDPLPGLIADRLEEQAKRIAELEAEEVEIVCPSFVKGAFNVCVRAAISECSKMCDGTGKIRARRAK